MISSLRRQLCTGELARRLYKLIDNAPAAAPVSLHLELGKFESDWLLQLPDNDPFWYRARPAEQEFQLGIGHALHVTSTGANRFAALDNTLAGFDKNWRREGRALAFAGFSFDPVRNTSLPSALLAIPAILLECRQGQCSATLSTLAGNSRQAVIEWQRCLRQPSIQSDPEVLSGYPETLLQQAWMARAHAALREIGSGRIDKIVLSRTRKLTATRAFSPAAILSRLIAQQPASLIYAHGNGQQTFLGATPERLISLEKGQVLADALAGTAWPGSTVLAGQKNLHEQALVVQAVCTALSPLCLAQPQVGPVQEHQAGHLRHLRSQISATALPGTTLFDLVHALHPTPAVGGFPTRAALDWLSAHDEQRPAWYSGGFGTVTPEGDGEFSVALRSALLEGNKAELQAGAGIVTGSDPELEWAETEAKLATLLDALHPGSHCTRNSTNTKAAYR
jgi:salicylate biosynthesis isochorismate synthase